MSNQHPCRVFNDKGDHNRFNLYQFIFETSNLGEAISYLEFGVSAEHSLKWWTEKNKNPESRFVGFDTFTGLPEKWDNVPKGTFTMHGKPPQILDDRCRYEMGLFQDTLSGFLERTALDRRTVVHLDADLYSSTLFVLTTLAHKLKKGDIIIFDELGSLRHTSHEFRSFDDFSSAYLFRYKVIGASNFYLQVALELL